MAGKIPGEREKKKPKKKNKKKPIEPKK